MRSSWGSHEILMRSSLRLSWRHHRGHHRGSHEVLGDDLMITSWGPHEVSSCGYESSDIFSRTTRLFWKNEHEISSVCTKFGLIEWISLMKNRHFYIKHEILTVTGRLCVVLRIHFTVPFNVKIYILRSQISPIREHCNIIVWNNHFRVVREGSEFTGWGGRRFVLFGVENKTRPPCRRPKILPGPPLHDFTIEK